MGKDWRLYIDDMYDASSKMIQYAGNLTVDDLLNDRKTYDALVKNVIVLGEAAGMIPDAVRMKYPEIDWRRIVATRNLFVHQYDDIDEYELIEIIHNDLPVLLTQLKQIISENK